MKKKVFVFVFASFLYTLNTTAQVEKCETSDDLIEDVNSITKCTVETKKSKKQTKSKEISVKVSASARYLKKRIRAKKTTAAVLGTSGIASAVHNAAVSKSIVAKKSISAITSKLSKEQLRSASPFENVDRIPLFESCKDEKSKNMSNCFNTEMMKHIQKHFRYPNEAVLGKIEGEVWVRFVIDHDGNVVNIKTLGPENGELLNEEAKRVVAQLPKFVPATTKGKKVLTKYGFPITFSLED